MSAVYALAGDVIHVRNALTIRLEDGEKDELTPGYYAIAGQFGDDRLALATVGEGEDDTFVACHPVHVVSTSILATELVGITYMKVSRWALNKDEQPMDRTE